MSEDISTVAAYDPYQFAATVGQDYVNSFGASIMWPSDLTKPLGYDELLADLLKFENDPYGFVLYAFPWGEPGTALAHMTGPEPWQAEILILIRDGIISVAEAIVRISIRSGHGIGKSAMVAWLILWAMLKEDTRGVVTANSERQLRTKTWAELGKWFNLYIGKDLFRLTATSLFPADREKLLTWRIDMIPWSEHNTTAFQGLHNQGKRILIIFDEASEIPKIIWDVASGALSDANTQIIWFAPGNPTMPSGHFYNIHQPAEHNPWIVRRVDSRSVSFTNKSELNRQIAEEGESSDFVRIRILGEFPSQGLNSFISRAMAEEAQVRQVHVPRGEPIIIGVDVARFGSNSSIIYPRQGRDARTRPYVKLNGADTMQIVDAVLKMMAQYQTALVAVDGGGVGGGVVDRLRQLGVPVVEVQFGSKASPPEALSNREKARYANKRAEIWGALRDWLRGGALPEDPQLIEELCAPLYAINSEDVIRLEPKVDIAKRLDGLSPDIADALAITFAIDSSFYTGLEFGNALFGHNGGPPLEPDHNPYEGFRTYM
jgi:hypothetical protein